MRHILNDHHVRDESFARGSDVEKLIVAVDGQIRQGEGSRIRIVLGEQSLNIHTPHPQKELKPYQVRAIRKLFIERGMSHEIQRV